MEIFPDEKRLKRLELFLSDWSLILLDMIELYKIINRIQKLHWVLPFTFCHNTSKREHSIGFTVHKFKTNKRKQFLTMLLTLGTHCCKILRGQELSKS